MMNQSDIFKKIGVILNELQEQYEFLARNPEQLNELELELFLANASFLSDHAEIVRKLNASKTPKELPSLTKISAQESEQIPPKPVVVEQQPVVDDLPEPRDYSFFDKPADLVAYVSEEPVSAAPTFEFILNDRPESDRFDFEEEKSVDEIFDRPLSEEEAAIVAEKQRILTQQPSEPEEEPVAEPFLVSLPGERESDPVAEKVLAPEPLPALIEDRVEPQVNVPVTPPVAQPSASDEPVAARPTLNDLLANQRNGSIQNKEENAKPVITDLKKSITLNEKLLYIKDLFNGYNMAYSEAIDEINKMPDLKTADAFLKNIYAEKNNWQAKQATVDQFYQLLNRRFPEEA